MSDEPTDEEIEATCSPTAKRIAELERENAKLREALMPLAVQAADFYGHVPGSYTLDTPLSLDDARKAASALGMATEAVGPEKP